jgi:hypothetical protein
VKPCVDALCTSGRSEVQKILVGEEKKGDWDKLA